MNNNIETFTLTPKDTFLIVKGLAEIVPEDEESKTIWNISIVYNGKYFSKVPLSIIEEGPVAINRFSQQGVLPMSFPNQS